MTVADPVTQALVSIAVFLIVTNLIICIGIAALDWIGCIRRGREIRQEIASMNSGAPEGGRKHRPF